MDVLMRKLCNLLILAVFAFLASCDKDKPSKD